MIRLNFPDEMDQKKQAMSFWINTDPLVSWRRLIIALDAIGETKLADSIRFNAEPLTGTVYSVGYISQHTIWISPTCVAVIDSLKNIYTNVL